MVVERDKSIDIIRSIGLICIILAHINPPFTIFQIRNFDVPLMIFISGYLFGDKNQTFNSLNDFSSYLWKRFVRLVIPVWLFLSVFYSIQYAFPFLFKINYTDFPDIMISSYMLMDGFGYVWIIRVFLMIAILGPLCSRIIKNQWQLLLYYITYEIIIYYSAQLFESSTQKYIDQFGTYSLGFLIFFMLGTQYKGYTKKTKFILFIASALISIIGLSHSIWCLTESFDIGALKYPPRSFYISYAITIFCLIFWFKPIIQKMNVPILNFIGSSTIWIYLWHILFLLLINFDLWYINGIMILSLSIVTTFLQQKTVEKVIMRFRISNKHAKHIRIIFCS